MCNVHLLSNQKYELKEAQIHTKWKSCVLITAKFVFKIYFAIQQHLNILCDEKNLGSGNLDVEKDLFLNPVCVCVCLCTQNNTRAHSLSIETLFINLWYKHSSAAEPVDHHPV